MRRLFVLAVRAACLAGALGAAGVQAQGLSRYALTAPPLLADIDPAAGTPVLALGALRLGAAHSQDGNGLSLEAGEHWFARAGIGRSLSDDLVSVGGGYRFVDGEALSMQVMRQFGQERLGLALRYDWRRSYLRLSYETPLRAVNAPDRLRFSAGVRF